MAAAARLSRTSSAASGSRAESGATFESFVPATGEALASFPRSGAADVDRAVARREGGLRGLAAGAGAAARRASSSGSASSCATQKDELTDLMTREMGKVQAEAGGDVQEAIDMSYYMAGEGRRLLRPDDAERAARTSS